MTLRFSAFAGLTFFFLALGFVGAVLSEEQKCLKVCVWQMADTF
jgi:hypothetical protein